MTPEREAIAKIVFMEHERANDASAEVADINWRDGTYPADRRFSFVAADRIIAEHIAPLRSSLATAERERDEEKRWYKSAARDQSEHLTRALTAEARAASLQGLLSEAGKAVKELADDLSEWVEHHYAKTKVHPSEARRYERDIDPVVRARALLIRIQAREGGEEMGRG